MKELIADILGLVRVFHFTKDETFDKETITQNISTAINNLSSSVNSKLSGKSNVDHKHTKQDVTDLSNASDNVDGLLTKEDFAKLQGIEAGANRIIVDNELNANSHNPVENAEIVDKIYDKNAIHALMANIDVGHGKLLSINVTEDGVLQVDNDSFEYYTTEEVDAELAKKTVTFEKQNIPDSGFFATYVLKQNNVQVGPKMNIPRDWLPISGSVKTCTTQDTPVTGYVVGDKYLDIVLNTKDGSGTDNHLYILATDFIDDYGADNVTLQLVNRQFSIKDKGVSKAKLSDSVQTSLGYADTFNSSPCKDITSNNISNWNSKAEISDIPTKVSELTNDSGYLSSHQDISMKVDKVTGKGLSTEDYTSAEKTKLSSIETGANKTTVDSSLSASSTNPVQNKVVNSALGNKVDKVSGKGLSTEDYTSAEKTKLSGIQAEANKTTVDSSMSGSSTNPVQNKIVKDYVDGLVGDIVSGDVDLSSTHNHDDRYFTESEVTTKLSEKANSSHTHTKSQITDFPSSMTPTSHTDSSGAYGKATTSVWGHTKLNSATNSTDETTAATPKAVKTAYDLANGKSTVSFSPAKTSGTEIGTLTINGTATKLYQQDDNTTYSPATQSANGLMSSADKTKLDGIATGATKTVLNNTVTSTSTTEAATANAVKTAYDKANHSHPYAASSHNHTTHNTQAIASGTDLNTITTAGWYNNNSNSDVQKMSNTPWQATAPSSGGVGQAFAMEVLYTYGCIQILYPYNTNDIWVRRNNSNALGANNWTGWTKVFNSANLTKADITALGIPGTDTNTTYTAESTATNIKMNGTQSAGSLSTYARGDHVHPVDTSRAAASHTHSYISTAAGSVGASNLASNAVEEAKIKAGAVTNAKLADQTNTVTEYIVGTQTASTSAWTGKATKISSLAAGQVIYYKLPYASTNTAVTLNLTLADGTTTTGAKEVWFWNGTRATTNYGVNSVIGLIYNGSQWWVINPSNNNNNYYLNSADYYTSGEAFTTQNLIACKKADNKYYKINTLKSTIINLSRPILLSNGNVNANTNTNVAIIYNPWVNPTNLNGGTTLNLSSTVYQPVYLEGTAYSNGDFTISTTPITQTLTNGRYYILLGIGYATNGMGVDLTNQQVLYYNGTNLIPATSWNGITDKPSTFTPSTHTHTKSQITDFPSSMTPTSHSHGNITNAGAIGSTANLPVITGTNGVLQAGSFGTAAGTFCQGNDSRLSNARTPTSHTHGNITNAGAIGSTANLPVITGTNGVLQAGSFGTAANTFCQGNDSRLSNTRTPTDNTVTTAKIVDGNVTTAKIADSAITSAKIADGTIANVDIASNAAIDFSKLNITKANITGLGIPESDTNTTYSAGDGLNLSGTTFSLKTTTISNGTNLNTIKTPGFYTQPTSANTSNMTNIPVKKAFTMIVESFTDGGVTQQITFWGSSGNIQKFVRTGSNSGWSNWVEVTKDTTYAADESTLTKNASNVFSIKSVPSHNHTRTLAKGYNADDAGSAHRIWLYVNPTIRFCSLYYYYIVNSLAANATATIAADAWVPADYRPTHPSIGGGSFNSIGIVSIEGGVTLRNGSQALSNKQLWGQINWMY